VLSPSPESSYAFAIRIGIALNELDPAAVPADVRSAEAQGFDLVASGEHLFFHGPIPNAFVTLVTAAAVTDTSPWSTRTGTASRVSSRLSSRRRALGTIALTALSR
jgi:hypothetical protein